MFKKEKDDESAMQVKDEIDRINDEIDDLNNEADGDEDINLEDAKEYLKELEDKLKSLGESSSYQYTKHVMLFEQFVKTRY